MHVFLDFEASSLSDASYPIEIAWVFEHGISETHLIRPAPGWTDWGGEAKSIHKIERHVLLSDGEDHAEVARHMVEVLDGHDLLATAPSWDGKWLSVLLRAAGLPRHRLRLRDTEEAQRETAIAILTDVMVEGTAEKAAEDIVRGVAADTEAPPRHRALQDAEAERQRWLLVRDRALAERDRARG